MKIEITCIVGIDPGASGGIAVWKYGRENVEVYKMPKSIEDFHQLIKGIVQGEKPIIFLEKLNVRPDDVMRENGANNMGKMFRIQKMIANFEQLKTTLALCGYPFVLVHPMKWQSALKLRRKGVKEEKQERKRRYRDMAGHVYPDIKTTLWNADALMIMHFGRYVLQNDAKWVLENLPSHIVGGLK